MADDLDRATYRALLALAAAAGVVLVRSGITATVPAGADVMGHVARTDAGLHLLAQGHLDGWFDGFGSGYRLFAVYGPGLTVLVGIVKALTFGTVDSARAIAILGGLAIAAVPPSLAPLSRSLGASRRAAAIHGALGLSVGYRYSGGLPALYGPGLVPQVVAVPIQLLTAAALVRSTTTTSRRPVVGAAAGVATLLVLHPISLVVVLALLPGLVLAAPPTDLVVRTRLARAAIAIGAGSGLAGAWLVPAVQHRDLRGGVSGWLRVGPDEVVRAIGRGEALAPQALVIAAGLALAVTAGRAVGDRAARRVLVAPVWGVGLVGLGHLGSDAGWAPRELWVQLPNRPMVLTGMLLLLPLALLLDEAIATRPWHRTAATVGAVGAAALLVPLLLPRPLDPPQRPGPPSADLVALADALAAATGPADRHLSIPPSPFARVGLGTSEPVKWLAVEADRPTAELYFPEATRSPGAALLIGPLAAGTPTDDEVQALRRAGIVAIVVTAPEPARDLDGGAGLQVLASTSSLELRAVGAEPGAPDPSEQLQPDRDGFGGAGAGLAADLRRSDAEHRSWTVDATVTGPVVAAVAHDPAWRVEVDGEAIPTRRSSEGLLRFELPAGRHRVEATFTDHGRHPLGLATSLASAVALIAWAARPRRAAARRI